MPILKGRQGELNSLAELADVTRATIQPLIEVAPNGDRDDQATVRTACNKIADKLGKSSKAQTLLIDCGHIDLSLPYDKGAGIIDLTCRAAEIRNVGSVPVLRLDDPDLARHDVRGLHEEFARGVAIRLVGDDLDEDAEIIDEAVEDLLSTCGLDRGSADLILDAGPVESEIAARGAARIIGSVLRELDKIDKWRSVTVAGGAFLTDLSNYDPWVVGERQRFDADMWAHVINRGRPTRKPDYGDYAVAHPHLVTGVPFAPAPQLRYTTSDRWLIVKARRNHPEANDQFYRVCDIIARHPQFVGESLGAADFRIANSRAYGPGNATTWRQVETTHHLDLVARRITTFGEP